MSQDLAYRCVAVCAKQYNFDAEEAYRLLGLAMIKLERKTQSKEKVSKVEKSKTMKPKFPLPYNGEFNDSYCYALRQNSGLYTQCQGERKGSSNYCKSCANTMQKAGAEMPEYGTIQQRQAVGIFEYTDPKGRKPIAYTKIMKKYKINEEQVLEEAGKFNITVNPEHFIVKEETKRGRPSSNKKDEKSKGPKGRPKKEKKVLQIEGEDEDLFAALVAEANESEDVVTKKKSSKSDEEKEAERLAKEEEKAAKKLAAEKAKAEKEAKLAAEKAEKEAKKAAEKAEKEAKKAAEKAEKAEKEAKKAAEKAEKEAKLAAEKEAKKSKSSKEKPVEEKEEEEEEEPEVVKKIMFEDKKYLKSKKSGVIYDYNEYVNNHEQIVVGKWNDVTNKIDFVKKDDEEEEEEEYEV